MIENKLSITNHGDVAEWSLALVLSTIHYDDVSSNPVLIKSDLIYARLNLLQTKAHYRVPIFWINTHWLLYQYTNKQKSNQG